MDKLDRVLDLLKTVFGRLGTKTLVLVIAMLIEAGFLYYPTELAASNLLAAQIIVAIMGILPLFVKLPPKQE